MNGFDLHDSPTPSVITKLIRAPCFVRITQAMRPSSLRRELRLPSVIGVGVATIVGSGIFVVIGPITRLYAGSLGFLCFPLAAIPSLLSALCYAEFGSRFSCAGQAYTYLSITLGEVFGYLAGTFTVFSYLVATSAVAKGFELYMFDTQFVASGLIVVSTFLCLLGIKESAGIASFFAVMNCGFLVGIILYGGLKYGRIDTLVDNFNMGDVHGLLQAASLAYFTTLGWDLLCVLSAEMVDPVKDVPLGLIGSLSIVTVLYSALCLSLLTMMKPEEFDLNTPLSAAFLIHDDLLGSYTVSTAAGLICVSSVLTGILAPPRILQRMAHDGLMFRFFETCNRSNVPVYGTLLTGLVGCVLTVSLQFEHLAKLTSAASLVIFSLVSVGLLKFRRSTLNVAPPLLLAVLACVWVLECCSIVFPIACLASTLWEWNRAWEIPELRRVLIKHENQAGYSCPLVPLLPLCSILANSCILASLGIQVVSATGILFLVALTLYFVFGGVQSQ